MIARLAALVSTRYGALVLVALALAIRLGYVVHVGEGSRGLSADAQGYHDLAVNLVTRGIYATTIDPPHSLDVPYALRPPLTPLFLAAVYALTGSSWRAGQVALSLVGAVACVLTALLGLRLFGPTVGALAGLLAAAYPFFVFLPSVPLTENLAIPLHLALVLLLLRVADGGSWRCAAGAGIILGLTALNKPTILGFAPLLAAWLLVRLHAEWVRAVRTIAIVAGASIVVIAPWTVRNVLTVGAVVPVTTQGGGAMYQAVGEFGEHAITRLEQGARGWHYKRGGWPALDGLSPAEADHELRRLAIRVITENPAMFVDQAVRKVRIFWSAYPDLIHRVSWGAVASLAVIGVIVTRGAWRTLVPVYLLIGQTASIPVLFTSMPRFRAPIESFLLIFAAVPLAMLVRGDLVALARRHAVSLQPGEGSRG